MRWAGGAPGFVGSARYSFRAAVPATPSELINEMHSEKGRERRARTAAYPAKKEQPDHAATKHNGLATGYPSNEVNPPIPWI